MEKDAIMQKTIETLSHFETGNIVQYLLHLSVKGAITNPWFVAIFLVVAFYAVVVRSRFVLSLLLTAVALLILMRYTLPGEGETLTLSSVIPFALGALAIGAVLIYIYFIKTE
jgi:hypothetical protein